MFSAKSLSQGVSVLARCMPSVVMALCILSLIAAPALAQSTTARNAQLDPVVGSGSPTTLSGEIMGPLDDPYVKVVRPAPTGVSSPVLRMTTTPGPVDAVGINTIDPGGFPEICTFVEVLDADGNPITGQTADSFCVWQDSVKIDSFTVTELRENCPTSICLVIDVSGSMNQDAKIDSAKSAAHQFVDQMDVLDRVAIVKFESCFSLVQAFTSDKALLHSKINTLAPGGFTAALDGIWKGVDVTVGETGSKAVIALSDGMENRSGRCAGGVDGLDDGFADDSTLIVDLALGGSVPIYTISLGNTFDPQYLVGLANGSGGAYYHAPSGGDIIGIYETIKFRLCSRYMICYTSPDTIPSGDCHDVIVCHQDVTGNCAPCDTSQYCEPDQPRITLLVDPGCQRHDTDVDICAIVVDSDTPAESLVVKLFYRNDINAPYIVTAMNRTDSTFCFTIPGSLLPCDGDSIQYYVTASDGKSTVSSPNGAPTNAHSFGVCPSRPPVCMTPPDTHVVICGDETICLPVGCSDPDDDLVPGPSLIAGPGSISNGLWCYQPVGNGQADITIQCVDSCGLTCEATFAVSWEMNSAPVCSLTSNPAPPLCTPPLYVLTWTSSDPDGDPTECYNTNPNATLGDGTWQYAPTPGETVYDTIICVDSCGLTCSIPIEVTFPSSQAPICEVPSQDVNIVMCEPVFDSVPVSATGGATCELYNNTPGVLRNGYWVYKPAGDEAVDVFVRCFTECDTCTASFIVNFDVNQPPVLDCPPAGISVSCDAVPPPAEPVATDDRPGVIVSFTEDSVAGNCANSYTLTRTWIATDSCGLTDTCTQVVNVYDTTPPEILCGQTDHSVDYACDEVIALTPPQATDNCDPNPSVKEFRRDSVSGFCATDYTLIVTWEAKDACGNVAYCADTVRVADTTAPVCSVPNDTTIFNCAPGEEICLPVGATDDCGTVTCEVISGPGQIGPNGWCFTPQSSGEYQVGVRCTDACGNSCESVFTVVVDVNSAPDCDLPADTTITLCEPVEVALPVSATDIDGNLDVCRVANGPGTLIDGFWYYTPAGDEVVTVEIVCVDTCGAECRGSFTVTFDVNEAPVCDAPGDTTIVLCGKAGVISLPLSPTDVDGNLDTCRVSLGTLVKGVWSFQPPGPGEYCVEVTCVDYCQVACVDTFCVTVVVPDGPVCHVPSDTTIFLCESGEIALPLWAEDYQGDTVQCLIDGPGEIRDGYWVYTPTQSGEVCVLVQCADDCGSVCETRFCINIMINRPPVSEVPQDTVVYNLCDTATICVPFGGSDPDGNLASVELVDPTHQQNGEWCLFADADGIYTNVVRSIDSCGAVGLDTFVVVVNLNEAPVCQVPNDTTIVMCAPEEVCIEFGAYDPDGNLASCGFANVPGQRGGCKNPPCPDNVWCYTPDGSETVTVYIRCVDSCGLVCEDQFTVTFVVNTPPVCETPQGGPSIPQCADVPSVMPVGSSDADGDSTYCVLVSGPGTLTDGVWSYMPVGGETIDVVIRCYDVPCGDSCETSFQVTYPELGPSYCNLPNDTAMFLCDTATIRLPLDSMSECRIVQGPGEIVGDFWTLAVTEPLQGCVVVECIDTCGAVCIDTFCVQIDVNTPPVFEDVNDMVFSCADPGWFFTPSVTDPDSNIDSVYFSYDSTAGNCPQAYVLTGTWIAVDSCGLADTTSYTIRIEDNDPPVLTCPEDMEIACDDSTTLLPWPTVRDDCDTNVTIELIRVDTIPLPQQCGYNLERHFRAYDDCGNEVTCVHTVRVIDNIAPVIECPDPVTYSCDAVPDSFPMPTVSDNCDASPVLENVTAISATTCGDGYELVKLWVATDACGNADTCSQVIIVADTTAPEIVCPADTVIDCVDGMNAASLDRKPWPYSLPQVTDNCDDSVAWNVVSVSESQIGTCEYTVRYGLQAIDACENVSDTCFFTVTFIDSTAPVLVCPPDTSMLCEDFDRTTMQMSRIQSEWMYGIPTATDNCDAAPRIKLASLEEVQSDTCPAMWRIGYIAIDSCDNSSDTCFQTVFVIDTTPPTMECPPPARFSCGDVPVEFPVPEAFDNCTGQGVPMPVELIRVDTTYLSPDSCLASVRLERVFRATDPCGNVSECTHTVEIIDDVPPEITCPPPVDVACDDSTYQLSWPEASDLCDPDPSVELVSTDTIPGQSPCDFRVEHKFIARDACGNVSECTQVVNVYDSIPPLVECPPELTVACDDTTSDWGWPVATDNCDPNPVVSLTLADTTYTQDLCVSNFTVRRTWSIEDRCGNLASECVQLVHVVDTVGPQIVCPPDTSVSCGELDAAALVATFASSSANRPPLPSFGTPQVSDACNPEFTWSVVSMDIAEEGCPSVLRIGYQASDYCGNESEICYQMVTLIDTLAPVAVECPGPFYLPCDSLDVALPKPSFDDNCTDPKFLTVVMTGVDTVMTPGDDYCYKFVYRWEATDSCGNTSAPCLVEVRVTDDIAPVVNAPGDLEFSCAGADTLNFADSSLGWAWAEDNCGPVPTVELVNVTIALDSTCPGNRTVMRTFEATDACGNQSQMTQAIRFYDDEPPVLAVPDYFEPFSCDSVPDSLPPPLAVDACDPNPVLTLIDERLSDGDCPQARQKSWVWEAMDACGNADTATVTITLLDYTPPEVTCPPDTVISCDELPDDASDMLAQWRTSGVLLFGEPQVTDNCDPQPVWRFAGIRVVSDTCPWQLEYGFDAVDGCGNVSDTCYQTITIVDTVAPLCILPQDTAVFFCEPGAEICLPIKAEDNCAPRVSVSARTTGADGITSDNILIVDSLWCYTATTTEEVTVVVEVNDACGNTCIDSFMVSITINEAPECNLPNDSTIYLCDTATFCWPYGATDRDNNLASCEVVVLTADGRGVVDISDTYCWFVGQSETVSFVSTCYDSCGAACEDTVTFNFVVSGPPECRIPTDQKYFLCNIDTLLTLSYESNADSCWISSGPGELVDGQWQYTPSGVDESFYVALTCENMCGICVDSFFVDIDVNDAPVCNAPTDTTIYLCGPGEYCMPYPNATDADGNLSECGIVLLGDGDTRRSGDMLCLFAESDTIFTMVQRCVDECGAVCEDTFRVTFVVDEAPVCESMPDTTVYVCDTATICIPYHATDADSSLKYCSVTLIENDRRFGEMYGELCFFAYQNETYTFIVECVDTCGNVCSDTVLVTVVQSPPPVCEMPADTAILLCATDTLVSLPYGTGKSDTCAILRGPGELADGFWNYAPAGDEEFWVVVECANLCGSCVDSFFVDIDVNEPPVCNTPNDTTIFACKPGEFCLPYRWGMDVDGNLEECWVYVDGDKDGRFASPPLGEEICFYADADTTYTLIASCVDACGAVCEDTFYVSFVFNQPPSCNLPNDTTIYLCDTATFCFPWTPTDPDDNLMVCALEVWTGDTQRLQGVDPCWFVDHSETITFWAECTDSCGAVCTDSFVVEFIMNEVPVCVLPDDYSVFFCEPDSVSLGFASSADTCYLVEGPGVLENGSWNYYADHDTTFSVTIRCVNFDCESSCEGSFLVEIDINDPPMVVGPPDTTVFLCEVGDTVCLGPWPESDPNGNAARTIIPWGTTNGNNICFVPDTAGVYTLICCVEDSCGFVACDTSYVTVVFNTPPVCEVPNDTTIFMCAPTEVCIPFSGFDADGNLTSCGVLGRPGARCPDGRRCPDNIWCYTPQGPETVEVFVRCEDACGAVCETSFLVTFVFNKPPVCETPNDTTIYLCDLSEVMIPLGATDPDENFDSCYVADGPGMVVNNQWVYTPSGDETDTVTIICVDACDAKCRSQFVVTFDVNQAPICETQPQSPPRCVPQRMVVPILTEDPDGDSTVCSVASGPGEVIDNVWQWDPIPGTVDTVVIHCVDTCGAICEIWFPINIPTPSPPVCLVPASVDTFLCEPTELRLPVSATNGRDEKITCELVDGPGEVIGEEWVYNATTTESFEVTIRCTDICGDFCENSFFVDITINSAPVCNTPADQEFFLCASEEISLPFSATDIDDNLIGCTIVSGPGEILNGNWVFTPTTSGLYTIGIECKDGCGATCESSFTVRVDIDEPPVCILPSDTVIAQCAPTEVRLPVSAIFFEPGTGDAARDTRAGRTTIPFSNLTIPTGKQVRETVKGGNLSMAAGLTDPCELVSGPGAIIDGYWVYTPSGSETVTVAVRCTDDCGLTCEDQFQVTFDINEPPVCSFRTPSPALCAPPLLVVPFDSSDPEGGPVSCEIVSGPGELVDHVWQYAPIPGENIAVTIHCYDTCGDYCTIEFQYTVPQPQPPVCVVPTEDQSFFLCGPGQISAPVSATGGAGEVTCEVISGPGAIVSGQWVYNATEAGEFDVTVQCADACGTSCQSTFHVVVAFNTPPTCNLPADQIIEGCDPGELSFPVSADDIDGNLTNCEIIAGPGVLVDGQWVYTPTGAGTVWVTIRCTDECGAICEGTFSVTTGSNSPPVCGVDDQYFTGCDQVSAVVPLNTTDPDGNLKRCRVINGPGTIVDGNWIYTSAISRTFNVTIECQDSCGAVCTDDFAVTFDLNDPPVCNFRDTTIVLCGLTDVSLALDVFDPDGNLASCTLLSGPGSIVGNEWKYHLLEDTPVTLTVQCVDECGMTCISTFTVSFQFGDLNLCNYPWEDTVALCGPGEFCFDVPPGCRVSVGMAKVQGADMCFLATEEGSYWATIECTDDCGNVCRDSASFTVIFTDLPNCGPTITSATPGDDTANPDNYRSAADGPCGCAARGDLNGDGKVSAEDLALIVSVLFQEQTTLRSNPECPVGNLSDVDCNGIVDIRDAQLLGRYMFRNGASPCSDCAAAKSGTTPAPAKR